MGLLDCDYYEDPHPETSSILRLASSEYSQLVADTLNRAILGLFFSFSSQKNLWRPVTFTDYEF